MKSTSPTDLFKTAPKEYELTELTGKGTLPAWIAGKLVRNGPALFELESTILKHWFDGYGMLHGFLFQDGKLFYQSKYIRSDEYLNATTSGKVQTVAWGTASDPCRSLFRRFMANFSATPTNTNVNVIKVGDKYFTTSEIATINEFDVDSLDTLSNFTAAKGGVMAAHPSYTDDNRTWNMTAKFGPVIKNNFVEITDAPATIAKKSFQTKKLFYFHSFGNTDRYQIAIEQPMKLDFGRLIKSGITNTSFYECFDWDEQATNTFHIYDRQNDTIQTIESDLKFFFFHTINTYEQDGKLILDLCGYNDNSIVDNFYRNALATTGIEEKNKASLRRITIDLEQQSVVHEGKKMNIELPAINDAYRNTGYRYAYGVHSPKGNNKLAVQILKYDQQTNTHILWGEDHSIVGEPIFVAAPSRKSEDDGALLVLCHNDRSAKASLVVLAAQDLTEICRYELPQTLPPALHGWFYGLKK